MRQPYSLTQEMRRRSAEPCKASQMIEISVFVSELTPVVRRPRSTRGAAMRRTSWRRTAIDRERHTKREMLRHAIWIVMIVALSFIVRAGTAHFVGGHLDDAGWFQSGSYRIFDQRAQNI